MRRYMAFTILCAVCLSLWGCMQKTYTAAPPEGVEPTPLASAYRFEDLPVPATMSLVRTESYIFEAGTLRAAIMVYQGKDDPSELVKYYRDNMPQHEWKLVSVFEHQEANLTFRKPGWRCSIGIARRAMQPTRLVILIGPEGEKA